MSQGRASRGFDCRKFRSQILHEKRRSSRDHRTEAAIVPKLHHHRHSKAPRSQCCNYRLKLDETDSIQSRGERLNDLVGWSAKASHHDFSRLPIGLVFDKHLSHHVAGSNAKETRDQHSSDTTTEPQSSSSVCLLY